MSEQVTVAPGLPAGHARGDGARRRRSSCSAPTSSSAAGTSRQVKGLGPEFGIERVLDTPISEAAMVAAGVGAAMNGMRPVVDLNFIDFAFGAMDEIVNQAAKIRYMFGTARAARDPGVVRRRALRGPAQQQPRGVVRAHCPGLLVVMPSTPADTKGLLKTALRGEDPVDLLHAQAAQRARAARSAAPTISSRSARPRSGDGLATSRSSISSGWSREGAQGGRRARGRRASSRGHRPADDRCRSTSRRSRTPCARPAARRRHRGAAIRERRLRGRRRDPGGRSSTTSTRPVVRVGAQHSPIPHSPTLIDVVIPQAADIERAARALFERVAA